MADRKISELTNITGANLADDDEFALVDTSADETKAITFGEFKTALDTATGFVRITGDTMTGNLSMGDNVKAIFGAGSDLQIYHDGSRSIIQDNGTGNLRIQANNLELNNADNSENYLFAANNGAVTMYYDNAERLNTTSTGVDITGVLSSDGLTVENTSGATLNVNTGLAGADSKILLHEGSTASPANGASIRYAGATNEFSIGVGSSVDTKRISIARDTGDISFYEDTGTTPKFFWDASAESLGIGTSSPSTRLTVGAGAGTEEIRVDAGAGWADLTLNSNATNGGHIYFNDGSNAGEIFYYHVSDYMAFNTAATERMRIDSSGNLLVGKTTSSFATAGTTILPSGNVTFTRSNAGVVDVNRLSSDGSLINLYKDGSTVGSIGVGGSSAQPTIGSANTGSGGTAAGLRFDRANNAIEPWNVVSNASADSTIDLGYPSIRYKDLYLSGGVFLGGTGSANKLDDYEFGSYEPTVTATGGGTITLNTAHNSLAYTKIGDVVHVTGLLVVSSISSPSGRIRITLPFSSANLADSAERTWPTAVSYFNGTGTSDGAGYYITGIFLQQGGSYNYVELTPFPRNGAMDLDAADWCGTGSDLQMSLTYFAA